MALPFYFGLVVWWWERGGQGAESSDTPLWRLWFQFYGLAVATVLATLLCWKPRGCLGFGSRVVGGREGGGVSPEPASVGIPNALVWMERHQEPPPDGG